MDKTTTTTTTTTAAMCDRIEYRRYTIAGAPVCIIRARIGGAWLAGYELQEHIRNTAAAKCPLEYRGAAARPRCERDIPIVAMALGYTPIDAQLKAAAAAAAALDAEAAARREQSLRASAAILCYEADYAKLTASRADLATRTAFLRAAAAKRAAAKRYEGLRGNLDIAEAALADASRQEAEVRKATAALYKAWEKKCAGKKPAALVERKKQIAAAKKRVAAEKKAAKAAKREAAAAAKAAKREAKAAEKNAKAAAAEMQAAEK